MERFFGGTGCRLSCKCILIRPFYAIPIGSRQLEERELKPKHDDLARFSRRPIAACPYMSREKR